MSQNSQTLYILLDVTGLTDTKPQRGAVEPICDTVWRVYYQMFNNYKELRQNEDEISYETSI